MKTLFKTYDEQQARAKKQQYEQETGVTWDFYHTGDGYRLTAIYTKATPYDEAAADKLLPWLTYEFQTYTALAERSGIPLAQVVSGAKTLDRLGLAMPTCNRNGNLYAIRKRHSFKVQR